MPFVDLDFNTKARMRGSQLSGRNEVRGYGDRTAVIRDSKGLIIGRTPKIKAGSHPKTMKVIIKGKSQTIKVRPHWNQGDFVRGYKRKS